MATTVQSGRQQQLGQFLTPEPVARFMASLFGELPRELRLLDAGAGAGILSSTVVRRLCRAEHRPERISITAYELDESILSSLEQNYAHLERECLRSGIEFQANIVSGNFLESAASLIRGDLFSCTQTPFNAAVLNPPYRKIHGDSIERRVLRSIGIETSNLYTGFLTVAARLLTDGGEMVAITPRSFCNGPYFRSFRREFLAEMSLRRLHLFDSRSSAFSGDEVLQENMVFHAVKSHAKPKHVVVSASEAAPTEQIRLPFRAYEDVVSPDDPDQFIHLLTNDAQESSRNLVRRLPATLAELKLEVSTGRVVAFRARDFLVAEPEAASVPLIYPCHLRDGHVRWPLAKSRKPNAIRDVDETQQLLVRSTVYVLVKRFTSKEERRRVVACVYDPVITDAEKVGFENHLNYFHARGAELPMPLAKGLAGYLNSSVLDSYFRQFNGHTQVNATDLRSIPYPSRNQLERLGSYLGDEFPTQDTLDNLLEETIS